MAQLLLLFFFNAMNVLAAKPKTTLFLRAGVWRCAHRSAVHEPARRSPKNHKQRDPVEQGHGTTAAAVKNISCKLKYTEHTL